MSQTDRAQLFNDWATELQLPFDRVVPAYVLHEFDLATRANLLQQIASHFLASDGCILVADIAFIKVVRGSSSGGTGRI